MLRQGILKVLVIGLGFMILIGYPCAYGKTGKAPAQKVTGVHLKELEARLERLLKRSTYRYEASGKPDPFRPFIQAAVRRHPSKKASGKASLKKALSKVCHTPLECLDVGQLTLVGVVELEGDGAIAMAQDSSGIGYTIRLGDRIGLNNGKVTAIFPDRVVVTEVVEDIEGNMVPRKRVLLLHPEEE